MEAKRLFYIIGVLLIVFSLSMLPPFVVNFIYHEHTGLPFVVSYFVTLITGIFLWLVSPVKKGDLKIRDGFLVVVLFWGVISLFAALPLMLAQHPHMYFTDAMFEAVSGFTTTGASVLTHIDNLPHSILFYRQELQFLGGMGIIVLAVAILPMLGIGGMQLYRAETPGPMKDSKLTPRITETAKALWFIYVGLFVCCALAYWFAGMSGFEAIGESFATVATGGFSMHDASFAYYHSWIINVIAMVFMLLGSVNFGLHYLMFKQRSIKQYFCDYEFKIFLKIILFMLILTLIVFMFNTNIQYTFAHLISYLFDIVSLATTTGLVASDFSQWPSFLPVLIMVVAIIGGCGGSTSGGIKTIRFVLMYKEVTRAIKRAIHPQAVLVIKMDNQVMPEHVIQGIWGFLAAYMLIFVVLFIALTGAGLDMKTAYGALAACFSNAGAGIGRISSNFEHISSSAKWILILAMFAGRLEIFTLLVLFSKSFWRR